MKKTLKIMILIESSRAFGRNLLKGISQYTRLYGPWEIYRVPPFYRDPFGKENALAMIHDWGADGLILRENKGFKDKIHPDIPTVISSESEEYIPGCGHIIGDHEAIGKMAAEHLIQLGFKHFAFCGFDDMYWSRKRCKGFCETVEARGYDVDVYKQPPLSPSLLWEKEQHYIVEWLKTLPVPTGLMACADERSEQILQACKIIGLKIPNEIAIIGADDDELICDMCYPTLSSIAFNTCNVGFKAAELLEKMIKSDPPEAERVVKLQPAHITTRQSTDVFAIDDMIVAHALHYIKNNCHKHLSVDIVADAVFVSRRRLERKFRDTLKISIHQQIVKYRIEKVEQLLIESDLSLSQIASKLDFTNYRQIDRYFKKYKGITPSEFCKQVKN